MGTPKWSILIATIGRRKERLDELLGVLMPQVEKYAGKIEVVAYWNNFEKPLSQIRQALVDDAKGEYISFIDDDDMVPEYYCDEVMKAIETSPDYVGWRMQLYNRGVAAKPTFHSLRHERWSEDDNGYYRNTSHLNPIKRSIALKGSFHVEGQLPEDVKWAEGVARHCKTESYISKVMYLYRADSEDSTWRGGEVQHYERPERALKYFRYYE